MSVCSVRELWKRKTFRGLLSFFTDQAPAQGAVMVKIPPRNARSGRQGGETGEPALRFELN